MQSKHNPKVLSCLVFKNEDQWFSGSREDNGGTNLRFTDFQTRFAVFFIYDTIRHYDTRESSTYPMDMFVLCLQWPKKSWEFDLNIEVYLKPTWTLNECNKSINGFHLQECFGKDLQNLTKLQQRVPTSYPKSQAHDVVEDNAVDCFGQSISIVSSLTLCPPSSSTSPLFQSISLISNDGHT